MKEGLPYNVKRAILDKDADALKSMGRAGGKAAAARNAERQVLKEHKDAIFKEGIEQNRIEANEHIVTPDGEEGDFPDGEIQ